MELNILDVGKIRLGKDKLAFGVIVCSQSTVSSLPWQECKNCIGQWTDSKSYSCQPVAGTKHCHLFSGGKMYASSSQLEVGDRIGMLIDRDEGTLYFFHNGMDLGLAFDNIPSGALLPAVSIQDKVRVRLCFPPPPYSNRDPRLVRLSTFGATTQRYRKRT